jgi:hypothetical protein
MSRGYVVSAPNGAGTSFPHGHTPPSKNCEGRSFASSTPPRPLQQKFKSYPEAGASFLKLRHGQKLHPNFRHFGQNLNRLTTKTSKISLASLAINKSLNSFARNQKRTHEPINIPTHHEINARTTTRHNNTLQLINKDSSKQSHTKSNWTNQQQKSPI